MGGGGGMRGFLGQGRILSIISFVLNLGSFRRRKRLVFGGKGTQRGGGMRPRGVFMRIAAFFNCM